MFLFSQSFYSFPEAETYTANEENSSGPFVYITKVNIIHLTNPIAHQQISSSQVSSDDKTYL